MFTDTPKSCQPTAGLAEVQPCDWSWPRTYQWVCAAVRPARPSIMSISSPVVVLVIHHAGHAAARPVGKAHVQVAVAALGDVGRGVADLLQIVDRRRHSGHARVAVETRLPQRGVDGAPIELVVEGAGVGAARMPGRR